MLCCSMDSEQKAVEETFNIDAVIARLIEVRQLGKPGKTVHLKETVIRELCAKCRLLFLDEPMLLEVKTPVNICGDIHGQYYDMLKLFEKGGFPPMANYLFLGDYVDRGKQSIEVFCLLMAYKLKYPDCVHLLRGNHECAAMSRNNGFYDECKRRYNISLWKAFIEVFNVLPVAAVVDKKIFCVHGGLSPHLTQLSDIARIPRPTDVPDDGLLCDLLWADPDPDVKGFFASDRGVSVLYGVDVVEKFCKDHGLCLICRAHQVVDAGFEFFAHRRLVTLYSVPDSCGEFDNCGAMMHVDEKDVCSFYTFKRVYGRKRSTDKEELLHTFSMHCNIASPTSSMSNNPTNSVATER